MATKRDIQAEITREKILEAAAEEIYRVGFQAASISEILKRLGISKGALYHHFDDKMALGHAVLDEVFGRSLVSKYERVYAADDPLAELVLLLKQSCNIDCQKTLTCGCPINNLAQEMSPIDEGFRTRIDRIYANWQKQLTRAFMAAQERGVMRRDIQPGDVAYFVIAATQGAVGLAKNSQDGKRFAQAIKGLLDYLESLRRAAA